MQELELLVGVDDKQSIGLPDTTGHLRQELRAGNAHRDRQRDLPGHINAEPCRDLLRRSGQSQQATDVQKGLVDRDPFNERCHILEDLEHRLARLRIGIEVRVDEDQLGAQTLRCIPRHWRVHPEPLGLIACGKDNTAAITTTTTSTTSTADGNGFPLQGRVITLLDGRVERIKVGVEY